MLVLLFVLLLLLLRCSLALLQVPILSCVLMQCSVFVDYVMCCACICNVSHTFSRCYHLAFLTFFKKKKKIGPGLVFSIVCMHTHQQSVVVVVVDDVVDKHIFYVHTDLITCLLACLLCFYLLTCLLACERHIVFVFFEVPGKMPSPSSIFVFTDPGFSAEDSEEGLLACL